MGPLLCEMADAGSKRGAYVAVIKTIDLVGVSTESWKDAANDGTIVEYLTHVRIKFRIER